MSQIISYTATSGDRVDFAVGQPGLAWRDVAGVYMFCARTEGGVPVPVYIGSSDSFRDDIPGHPQWNAASALGAMAVLVKTAPTEQERTRLRQLLLADFAPPLNAPLQDDAAPLAQGVHRFTARPRLVPAARI
jgi:hypothetical protein